jgi:small-conductance mechanosensitive channel
MELGFENLLAQFVDFLPKLISGVVIFFVALYVSAWAGKVAARAMERRQMDPEIILLLRRVVRIAVLIIGVIQALAQVDFNVTSLIAGLGIAGFTIGFALQDVAKNFVAGVLLLLEQPFSIGDDIEVAGYTGSVTDVTLRTTELNTWDGRNVLIPNGDVYVKPIVNYSRDPRRRIQLTVSVGQKLDHAALTDAVLGSLAGGAGLLQAPPPEAVWIASSQGTTELNAFYWIDTSVVDLREAQNFGIDAVRAALDGLSGEGSYSVKASLTEGR